MNSIFSGFSFFIGIILVILGMILLYVKIIPKKFDGSFSNKFLQAIHDYFNFKRLYLESVLKFIFTLLTVICIVAGAVSILSSCFGIFESIGDIIRYGMPLTYLVSQFLGGVFGGIVIIFIGSLVIRLVYIVIIIFIIIIKNIIEINNKMK